MQRKEKETNYNIFREKQTDCVGLAADDDKGFLRLVMTEGLNVTGGGLSQNPDEVCGKTNRFINYNQNKKLTKGWGKV